MTHIDRNGKDIGPRVFGANIGMNRAAENCMQGNTDNACAIVNQWVRSSGHERNMRNPLFTQSGMSIKFLPARRLLETSRILSRVGQASSVEISQRRILESQRIKFMRAHNSRILSEFSGLKTRQRDANAGLLDGRMLATQLNCSRYPNNYTAKSSHG